MWDIEDEKMNQLPPHISQEIKKLRDPHNLEMRWHAGGSLFFLNGEIPLNQIKDLVQNPKFVCKVLPFDFVVIISLIAFKLKAS